MVGFLRLRVDEYLNHIALPQLPSFLGRIFRLVDIDFAIRTPEGEVNIFLAPQAGYFRLELGIALFARVVVIEGGARHEPPDALIQVAVRHKIASDVLAIDGNVAGIRRGL